MTKYHAHNNMPQSLAGLSAAAKRSAKSTVKSVPVAWQDLIAEEKVLCDKLDYADYKVTNTEALAAAGVPEDTDDDEDEDEDEEQWQDQQQKQEEEEGIDSLCCI
jgi:hypothetical protein